MRQEIFVFGSNLAGIHGAGAARYAHQIHGAKWGEGVGLTGNSYALPTKDENIISLTLKQVDGYILDFLQFAEDNQGMLFFLTPVGCGLAGFKVQDIKSILKKYGMTSNVVLTKEWIIDHE